MRFFTALTGSELGRDVNEATRPCANDSINRSYAGPLVDTVYWSNLGTGNSGAGTAPQTGTSQSGLSCREFQQTITIEGGCADGGGPVRYQYGETWRIVR